MRKIFITRHLIPAATELLRSRFILEENPHDQVLPREGNFNGILSSTPDRLDKEILENAKALRVISNCAAGLDNVDTAVAKERKINNVPDATNQVL